MGCLFLFSSSGLGLKKVVINKHVNNTCCVAEAEVKYPQAIDNGFCIVTGRKSVLFVTTCNWLSCSCGTHLFKTWRLNFSFNALIIWHTSQGLVLHNTPVLISNITTDQNRMVSEYPAESWVFFCGKSWNQEFGFCSKFWNIASALVKSFKWFGFIWSLQPVLLLLYNAKCLFVWISNSPLLIQAIVFIACSIPAVLVNGECLVGRSY